MNYRSRCIDIRKHTDNANLVMTIADAISAIHVLDDDLNIVYIRCTYAQETAIYRYIQRAPNVMRAQHPDGVGTVFGIPLAPQ